MRSEHDSDIKIKAFTKQIPQSFVTRFCAYNLLRYQVSVYRTIGPLVLCVILDFDLLVMYNVRQYLSDTLKTSGLMVL